MDIQESDEVPFTETRSLAISVKNVSVDFSFKYSPESRVIGNSKRSVFSKNNSLTLRALNNISFDVELGESVGIMGANGSGKSTLLSVLSGSLPCSEGSVFVRDTPRLMSLGAVLIPQVSGRRNIRLACLAQGISNQEIDRLLPELVDFTELGEAIDRPLATYSSGMRARVQFVVATALHPKILMIDEALGVGDKNFRKKSREKIVEIIESAGTFILVNHSSNELIEMCERGIWLESGRIRMDDQIDYVVKRYEQSA